VPAASPLLPVVPKGVSPENHKEKKTHNTSTRSDASSQNAQFLKPEKQKEKNECQVTYKYIISPKGFFTAKPTPERKRTKS
jgi:hypothetical protein